MTTTPSTSKTTTAFYAQAALSFAVAITAVSFGIYYLPVNGWIRAFLIVASLFLVTSSFTLAKVIRDAQEISEMERLDLARIERMLAERDERRAAA